MSTDPEPDAPAAAGDHLRIEVVRGGAPTPEQTAALAVALAAGSPGGRDALDDLDVWMTAWQRAALTEAVGARRIAERADLERPAGLR